MPQIAYTGDFDGRHPETGSVHNALAVQGINAPHTDQPYSEALLLGVSGGIAFGYFTFEYKGYDPHVALLTRNTFDPLERLLERLGIPQEVLHTTSANKGTANLIGALENGQAPLVWADAFSLSYHLLAYDENDWAMRPVLVTAYDGDSAQVVDGSARPFTVAADVLAAARGRVKKDKYRVLALDAPDERKLVSAVQKGIWDCISLFTDAPPRGAKQNFGFAAYEHFAGMLTNTRNKHSWAKFFAPGRRMLAALAGYGGHPGLFEWVTTFGAADGAERGLYADFLDEAALILDKPALKEAGGKFRESASAWNAFAAATLPDDVPLLAEIRQLLVDSYRRYVEAGDAGIEERRAISAKIQALCEQARADFPMAGDAVVTFREGLAGHIEAIHSIERAAVAALQDAMS